MLLVKVVRKLCVLIVADVEDEAARGDIAFAVCALFDLPAHKVAVIKK